MKLPLSIAAAICALALVSPAQTNRNIYTDSSANYPHGWNDGSNGGEGFGPWAIETRGSGNGWSGCGIWDPSANGFQGTWDKKTKAFGLVGKGTGFSVIASRSFRKPLDNGDSFSIEMAVNWDCGSNPDSRKGFVLTADGKDIVTVNHDPYPGPVSVYLGDTGVGDTNNAVMMLGYGLYPMVWTFTAKDETHLSVTASSRTNPADVYSNDFVVSSAAIDGFRLQSREQVLNPKESQADADKRQSYYDNFVLDLAGDLPVLDKLGWVEETGVWAITNTGEITLPFTLTRTSANGQAQVEVQSDNPDFVTLSTNSVTFENGETNVSFTGTAKLSGNAQVAKITASGDGFDPPEPWGVKGPAYSCSLPDGGTLPPGQVRLGSTALFAVTNTQSSWFPGDDSLVSVVSTDSNVLRVVSSPTGWMTVGDVTCASWTLEAVGEGPARIDVLYDGVPMCSQTGFVSGGIALDGPKYGKTGATNVYTLTGTFPYESVAVSFSVSDPNATVTPGSIEAFASGTSETVSVVFGDTPGTVTLTAESPDADYVASIDIVVSEPVDYSAYVAYDDASLYPDPGQLFGWESFESRGEGSAGFFRWHKLYESAEDGGVLVSTNDGGFPAIFSDGTAFGLRASGGDSPHYSIRRPFANYASLAPGQKASVEFVASTAEGARYVQFFHGSPTDCLPLFDIWNTPGGYIGANVYNPETDKLEDAALGWSPAARCVVASVERSADGFQYVLELSGYNEASELVDGPWTNVVESLQWPEGIQGFLIGASDIASDFLFNRLAVRQVAEPPADKLSLEGTGNVTSASAELPFKVVRPNSEGDLEVILASSDGDFAAIPTNTVTIPDGETEASFTVNATLKGNANSAIITARAAGVAGARFDIRGPEYSCTAGDEGVEEPWVVDVRAERTFWVNNCRTLNDFPAQDGLVTVESADENIVTVGNLAGWNVGDDGKTYTSCKVTGVSGGRATVKVLYDGVKMTSYDFTVPATGVAFDGPAALFVGKTGTYTLDVTLPYGTTDSLGLVAEPSDLVEISPSGKQLLEASGKLEFSAKALSVGEVRLSVEDDEGFGGGVAPIVLSISDASDYIAYDEASFYDGNFDSEALGVGTDKFRAWQSWVKANGETSQAGVDIVDSAADGKVLSDGSAFALHSYGAGDPEIQLWRPFVHPLSPGQAFSVELSPCWRDGSKGVKLQECFDGTYLDHVEFYYSHAGYFYKIDGGDPVSLGWDYSTTLVEISLQMEADGNSYVLRMARGGEIVTVPDLTFSGVVDCARFYSWNGGNGEENNLVFNRLAIQQVEESTVERKIGWGDGVWSPEGDGIYTITLTATTDDIGEVAIAVEPADGALSLSSDTVDFAGGKTVTIAYTLAGAKEGDSFRISATPADSGVAALDGEDACDVTVSGPYLSLWCDAGSKFTTDTTDIFLSLSASPSKYGTYTLVSTDPSVIALSREAITIPNDDGDSTVGFWVFVRGGGKATVYLAEDESVKWGFEISDVKPVDLKDVVTFEQGALKFKLPESATIMSTTNLVTGPWVAYPAEVGEDGEVVIPTTGPGSFYRIGEPPPSHPIVGTTVWEGSENMGNNWSKSVTVASDKFAGITAGTIIQIYADHNSDATYWQIKPLDGSWREITSHKDLVNEWGTIDLGSATETQFALNEADAKSISETGFIVMGYGITVKKVSIIQAATNAKKRTRDLSQPPGFCLP